MGFLQACRERDEGMISVTYHGRDVFVTLRDDVWQLEEPGTLSLTRTQAQVLRLHLNELGPRMDFDEAEEDG